MVDLHRGHGRLRLDGFSFLFSADACFIQICLILVQYTFIVHSRHYSFRYNLPHTLLLIAIFLFTFCSVFLTLTWYFICSNIDNIILDGDIL